MKSYNEPLRRIAAGNGACLSVSFLLSIEGLRDT
jgi:hypothetical protein